MKKFIALCILAALLLTGCGQRAPETAPATTQAAVVETEPAASAPTAPAETEPAVTSEVSGRPLHAELEFYPEGMLELCPVTLYDGPGYSLYIPDGDYELTEEGHWVAALNNKVEIQVVFYPGVTEDDLRTAITPAPLIQGEDGVWFLSERDGDSWDSPCLDVWLYPAENGVYALFSRYFLEAAEGFGARIATVASTFELTK